MSLSIEQIRAAKSLIPKRSVETPDLDGEVWVRALTLREVREIQEYQAKPSTRPVDVTKRFVELAACNEDGSPLFVGEDKTLIDSLTWGTIQAIANAATDISGLKADAEENARKN